MWENNKYKLCLKKDNILGFERIILSSGQCNFLLPMVFISDEGGLNTYYDCGGFVPLSNYRVTYTEDALYILEKVLLFLNSMVEYLINPDKIILSNDTVFYNTETGEIKIAYVPEVDETIEMRRHILYLIALLKTDISDGKTAYLDNLATMVYANSYSLMELVNKIGIIRRELCSQTSAS